MANYLVTGGCGFIGSHLVNKLVAEGHRVAVMDNLSVGNAERVPLGVELIVEDLANADKVNALVKEADGVFHLAAVASVEKCNNDGPERPGDIRISVGSPLMLERELGIRCEISLEKGLGRMLKEVSSYA